MKKFYSTIALTAAVVASASAFEATQIQKTATLFGQPSLKYELNEAAKVRTAAPNRIASAADIEGAYKCEYEPCLEQYTQASAMIEATDDAEVIITLNPWATQYRNIELDPIVASVDVAKSTLTLASEDNMEIGTFDPEDGRDKMWISIFVMQVNFSTEKWEQVASITADINSDGTIAFPETTRILLAVGYGTEIQGYVGGMDGLKFLAPDIFSYNASEWNYVGDGMFNDQNTNLVFKEEYQVKPVSVKMYQNKKNEALYLAENPYSQGGWTQVNADPSAPGYIVFSLENPDFVWMRPLTPSGMWMDLFGDGLPVDLYMYNFEGDYVFNQGMSVEDAAAKFAAANIVPSSYDSKTRVVKLLNNIFACSTEPFGTYSWTDIDGVLEFTMPDLSGVDGIYNDTENVAKRYFNLQGVEIANPEAGQVVIVKEGNKTSKTIVR